MGLFGGGKDWNIIAILYEKKGHYQVNGNRGKGAAAEKIRDNVKKHSRTIFWAVFDQKRAFVEGAPGPGKESVTPETFERIQRGLATSRTVQTILTMLEAGKTDKAAKELEWSDE
jgi:hypothetical protein